MVLFKNARDRQQIQTLARQIYPHRSKYFLGKSERATNKKHGILIVDLRSNLWKNDRFVDGFGVQNAAEN